MSRDNNLKEILNLLNELRKEYKGSIFTVILIHKDLKSRLKRIQKRVLKKTGKPVSYSAIITTILNNNKKHHVNNIET